MNSSRSFGNTNHAPQQLLNFKPSPFYEVVERLSNSATLPCKNTRPVAIDLTDLHRFRPEHRVHVLRLFCNVPRSSAPSSYKVQGGTHVRR